ncbi:MAG: SGNH/GDSL hydrolase family protein [Candidatus Portnoybacteria bacterium]|nr:SGNH/GDSL hydrolase family protein [Candidatus Portnoybacteria bacterium]MDD4982863.1 SGNH/GDSL hydrolase family protein [Candidatus Portnoybacteria bacterium]
MKSINRDLLSKYIINIAISIVAMAAVFSALEIPSRLFFDEKSIYDEHTRWKASILENFFKNDAYIDREDGLVYDLSDNKISEQWYLRNTKIEKEGTFRILAVGDSFTTGAGLESPQKNGSIYTNQLEGLLTKDAPEKAVPVQVINLSDGGLNTYQELKLFKEIGLGLQPDLLILQFTNNDLGPVRYQLGFNGSGQSVSTKTDVLLVGDKIVPMLPMVGRSTSSFLLKNSNFMRFVSYKLNLIYAGNSITDDTMNAAFDSLAEFGELAKKKNIPFILINFPPAFASENLCLAKRKYRGAELDKKLRKFAGGKDIFYANICDRVDDVRDVKSKLETGDEGGHYDERGHAVAAQMLSEIIRSNNLIKNGSAK